MTQVKQRNGMEPCHGLRRTGATTAGLVLLAMSLLSSLQLAAAAAVYTLVHGPGSPVTWYEEGLVLQVPEGYAARQARYVHYLCMYALHYT